jgi:hypothetical protein
MIMSNWLIKKLDRFEKRKKKKHIEDICKSKLQFMISLDGSYVSYQSMFVDLVNLRKLSGIKIDSVLPKDGDLRLKPKTKVVISYDFKKKKYKFSSMVLRKFNGAYPSFLITLPETIRAAG